MHLLALGVSDRRNRSAEDERIVDSDLRDRLADHARSDRIAVDREVGQLRHPLPVGLSPESDSLVRTIAERLRPRMAASAKPRRFACGAAPVRNHRPHRAPTALERPQRVGCAGHVAGAVGRPRARDGQRHAGRFRQGCQRCFGILGRHPHFGTVSRDARRAGMRSRAAQ